jgi:hypothetical protein
MAVVAAFKVRCPACGKSLRVEAAEGGTQLYCRACGTLMAVPPAPLLWPFDVDDPDALPTLAATAVAAPSAPPRGSVGAAGDGDRDPAGGGRPPPWPAGGLDADVARAYAGGDPLLSVRPTGGADVGTPRPTAGVDGAGNGNGRGNGSDHGVPAWRSGGPPAVLPPVTGPSAYDATIDMTAGAGRPGVPLPTTDEAAAPWAVAAALPSTPPPQAVLPPPTSAGPPPAVPLPPLPPHPLPPLPGRAVGDPGSPPPPAGAAAIQLVVFPPAVPLGGPGDPLADTGVLPAVALRSAAAANPGDGGSNGSAIPRGGAIPAARLGPARLADPVAAAAASLNVGRPAADGDGGRRGAHPAWWALFGSAAAAIAVLFGLAWTNQVNWFAPWEQQAAPAVATIRAEADALAARGSLREAHARYQQIDEVVAGREVRDARLRETVEAARADAGRVYAALLKQAAAESGRTYAAATQRPAAGPAGGDPSEPAAPTEPAAGAPRAASADRSAGAPSVAPPSAPTTSVAANPRPPIPPIPPIPPAPARPPPPSPPARRPTPTRRRRRRSSAGRGPPRSGPRWRPAT